MLDSTANKVVTETGSHRASATSPQGRYRTSEIAIQEKRVHQHRRRAREKYMDSEGTLRYILSVFLVPVLDRVPSKTLVDLLSAFGEAHVVGLGVCLHHHLSKEKKRGAVSSCSRSL